MLFLVRSSLKFMLAPMVVQLIKILVSNYSMERIIDIFIKKTNNKDEYTQDQRNLVFKVLNTLEPPKLTNILQLEDDFDMRVPMDYQSSSYLPLYHTIIQKLQFLYQKSLQSLSEHNRTPQSLFNEFTKWINNDSIAPIIKWIENKPKLKSDFEKDFVTHTLKMPNMQNTWLEICTLALRSLASSYVNQEGIIKLFMVNDSQLAFLNVCFKPLQSLNPIPSIEVIKPFFNVPQLETTKDIEFFASKMTVIVLWNRFYEIVNNLVNEEAITLLSNWISVFRSLISRLKNRKYLGLELEQQSHFDTMNTIYLYLINFNISIEGLAKDLENEKVIKHINFIIDMSKQNKYEGLHFQLILAYSLLNSLQLRVQVIFSFKLKFQVENLFF